MVRAVMRLLLFRSGRCSGVPVKADQVSAAVRGASMGAASSSASAAATAGAGGGMGRASAAAAAAAAAADAAAAPSWLRVAAAIKEAQARFARTLALEMAQVELLPASAAGKARGVAAAAAGGEAHTASRGSGAGDTTANRANAGVNTTKAYVLRSLLPSKFLAASKQRADPGDPRRHAPAVALVAAALVRLDRGGAGTPAADLWAVLSELGLPKPRQQPPSASNSSSSNSNSTNRGAPPCVPGIGDPAEAISAALASRLLVERRDERDAQGQPVTVYALGETAMGGDGKCSGIDEFITAMFETADPAQAIEGL